MDVVADALERAVSETHASASARSRARLDASARFVAAVERARGRADDGTTGAARERARRCEDALVRCVVEPAGEVSATHAAMALCARFRSGGGGGMHSRANELLDAATRAKAATHARTSAFGGLTRLVEVFGGKLGGNAAAYAREACGCLKRAEDSRCTRAALKLLAASLGVLVGGVDVKSAVSFYKAVVRLEGDRSAGVRAAVAEALGAIALARSPSRENGSNDLDVNAIADRIFRLLADDVARVRDAASSALANVALSCCQRSTEGDASAQNGSSEPAFARAARAFLYAPFRDSIRKSSLVDERVCLGVARAWVSFTQRAVRDAVAEHHEIAAFTVKTLLSEALEDSPYAGACAIYIIRVTCLAKADEASLRATLSKALEAFASTDVSRLLIALRTTKDAVEVIGSVDEELWESTVTSILKILPHEDRHVQAEAALALRQVALACPTKFVSQLREGMHQLEKLIAAVDAVDSTRACGIAFHVAALVSIGAEFTFGLPSSVLREAASLGIRCATGPGSARVREGGWIVISACLVGSGAAVASEMCGLSIKFALTATFDAVVETGAESEPGEIFAAAAAAEALSAWLIGKQSESSSLIPLLLSAISATERILSARQVSQADEVAKSLFRFRVFELLNSIQDTSFYEELHSRIVALCHRASQMSAFIDEHQPENFLKSQLSAEDAHLGPWTLHADENLDELYTFEGSIDSPHPRVWIGLSEDHAYPRSRSMRASTRQAEGVQVSKIFSASPQLRMSILSHFLNTAHRLVGTAAEVRESSERGVYTPKKQRAIEIIQSKALNALGSPFKGRRARPDELEEMNERRAAITLLCADVLAAAKHIVASTKTQDSDLSAAFKKVANVIRCAEFASTQHWRAIAEIHAFANALNADSESLLQQLVGTSNDVVDAPRDSPERNIVALSVAATFRHAGSMTLRQACTPVITNLLRLSMNVDHEYSSHIWSSHAICVIGTHTAQSFVRDAEDSINLAFALADTPFLLDEDNGMMTRVTAACLINTAISAIGPDLDYESIIYRRSETLMNILGEAEDPAVQLESTFFLQHVATFLPNSLPGRALVSKLRVMLKTATDASNTRAVMLILRYLLERDCSNVASHAGLDSELFAVLDRESDPKTRLMIKRCIELFIRDLCGRKPSEAMVNLSSIALHASASTRVAPGSSSIIEDDDDADAALSAHEEDGASYIERGAPKLSTRLFAAYLLSQLPTFVGDDARHRNLLAARESGSNHWLALHSQLAFDIAYRLSVSPVSALHAPGLDMFSSLMDLWANDEDPDSVCDVGERTMFVLEQYQAQLLSAMRATDPENASLESFLALLRLVSSALTSGITGEDAATTKRLANVVCKIARELREGTSDILCGTACDEAVALQAKEKLLVSVARIASSASAVIPEDITAFINADWIAAIHHPSERLCDEDIFAMMLACSALEQTEEDVEFLRNLCFKAMICGVNASIGPSSSHLVQVLSAARNIILRHDVGILPSEVQVITEAYAMHSSEAVRDKIASLLDELTSSNRVHPNAVLDAMELNVCVMLCPDINEVLFCRLFLTCLRLSQRSKRAARFFEMVIQHLFNQGSLSHRRLSVIRTIRASPTDTMLHALTLAGPALASYARTMIVEVYATSEQATVRSASEFISESLQTWASAFLSSKDNDDETASLRPLAIFLAIALEITSPREIPDIVIDASLGSLASQILVKLASLRPDPFRIVVGQLSEDAKARLQTLLHFKPPQSVVVIPPRELEFGVASLSV